MGFSLVLLIIKTTAFFKNWFLCHGDCFLASVYVLSVIIYEISYKNYLDNSTKCCYLNSGMLKDILLKLQL
ncbi:hypothetical protein NIES806_25340 [Dolichospermum compactum NIES-806]|uniref:Uncharacterized protein n=1 Tax=Dolichospermum compactum NIES-806 TaxID=1973481 RepID=A0A1Z4V4G5_9CYAN|nr:hypothetical protein NIES806_25340 [Dolichospermum compactum NIES-806]